MASPCSLKTSGSARIRNAPKRTRCPESPFQVSHFQWLTRPRADIMSGFANSSGVPDLPFPHPINLQFALGSDQPLPTLAGQLELLTLFAGELIAFGLPMLAEGRERMVRIHGGDADI